MDTAPGAEFHHLHTFAPATGCHLCPFMKRDAARCSCYLHSELPGHNSAATPRSPSCPISAPTPSAPASRI